VVDAAGIVAPTAETSQSPAVSEIDVMFAAVAVVNATELPDETVETIYSPTLPAFALLFVVVPTMPAVCDGVIVDVATSVVTLAPAGVPAPRLPFNAPPVLLSVVNEPVDAVVEPIGPGAANVAPPSCAALTAVLQVKPVPLVQSNALADVLQLGIENAATLAVEPVAFANTVLAAD
jgi:hypothetical protein